MTTMPAPTLNDESFKSSLVASAAAHLVLLLFLYFGLPHLMPPPPVYHPPVPFEIVELADITNTRVKEEPEPKAPAPEPPKPQPQTPPQAQQPPAPPAPPKPPAPPPEALKPAPAPPPPKPRPAESKPQAEEFNKLLKNLEQKKATPQPAETKPDSKAPPQPVASAAPSLSSRLTISEEDALRRQIESCWDIDPGARDAQNMVVEVKIDVNPDRTVLNTEIVDQNRYASDPFFRAAADRAVRAVRNPKCSPLQLPADKYDQWKHIDFTFDPRDLL